MKSLILICFISIFIAFFIPLNGATVGVSGGLAGYNGSTSFYFPSFYWDKDFSNKNRLTIFYVLEKIIAQYWLRNLAGNPLHLFINVEGEVAASENLSHKIDDGIENTANSFSASHIGGKLTFSWEPNPSSLEYPTGFAMKLTSQFRKFFFSLSENTTGGFILPNNFFQFEHSLLVQPRFLLLKKLFYSGNPLVLYTYVNLIFLHRDFDRSWGNLDNFHDPSKPAWKWEAGASMRIWFAFMIINFEISGANGDNLDDVSRFKLGGDATPYTKRVSGALFYEFFTDAYFLFNSSFDFYIDRGNSLYLYYDALRYKDSSGGYKMAEGMAVGYKFPLLGLKTDLRLSYLIQGNRDRPAERFKLYFGLKYSF